MWSYDTELCTNGVEASKGLSFYLTFFNLLDFTAVTQAPTLQNCVVTVFKSAMWHVLSGIEFLVAYQLYIGNLMRKCKISKSCPHQPYENHCHPNVFDLLLLWMARAQTCFQSWPKISWISECWKVWISAFFRYFEIIAAWMKIT